MQDQVRRELEPEPGRRARRDDPGLRRIDAHDGGRRLDLEALAELVQALIADEARGAGSERGLDVGEVVALPVRAAVAPVVPALDLPAAAQRLLDHRAEQAVVRLPL